MMEDLHISRSILSISSPGTHLTPTNHDLGAKITRSANEELSVTCAKYPKHFSFFASLPLPSVSHSLEEIDYALDKLGAVGFALLSNANGVYLGDKRLDPVFAKLNERKAVVFMHPTTCNIIPPRSSGDGSIQAVKPLDYPRPMIEFMFDETRAVSNLLLSGTVSKYLNIRFIMSHCGCALPTLLDRVGMFGSMIGGGEEDQSAKFKHLIRERFFFDLAGAPFPDQIHALLRTLGENGEKRLLYGSDFCFTPAKSAAGLAAVMDRNVRELFGVEGMKAVYSANAVDLFGSSAKL